ncbi:hypothetical protein HNY73_013791 [Argiope bruennichi]|uniref:Uncharacterized protein n=1 Tax=Argiope bruennichi TaxID=94029 RepID=A0A8T0EN20_ARGBR|nr:hypothetical protein HNY73_013791 [Argiope bruennichi]
MGNSSIKSRKKTDVSVQADYQQNQTAKHASTLTDIYGSGETGVYFFDVDCAQSDFEVMKIKCIRPGNNAFLENFVASPIELKATNPFLDNFEDFADVKKQTNHFKTDIYPNRKTLLLYQEVDEPPEIDPSCSRFKSRLSSRSCKTFLSALSPRRFLILHLSLSSRWLQACSVVMALLLPSRRLQKEPVSS